MLLVPEKQNVRVSVYMGAGVPQSFAVTATFILAVPTSLLGPRPCRPSALALPWLSPEAEPPREPGSPPPFLECVQTLSSGHLPRGRKKETQEAKKKGRGVLRQKERGEREQGRTGAPVRSDRVQQRESA